MNDEQWHHFDQAPAQTPENNEFNPAPDDAVDVVRDDGAVVDTLAANLRELGALREQMTAALQEAERLRSQGAEIVAQAQQQARDLTAPAETSLDERIQAYNTKISDVIASGWATTRGLKESGHAKIRRRRP